MFVDTKDVVASLTSGISQWGKLQTLKVQNIKGGYTYSCDFLFY